MFTGSPDPRAPIDSSPGDTPTSGPVTVDRRTGSTVGLARGIGDPPDRGRALTLDDLDELDDVDGFDDVAEVDDWMDEAGCKGRTNLFFGLAGERPERRIRRERAARDVCADCPVIEPCRERARAGRENGFWGGESEEERAAAGYPPRSISRRSVQRASGPQVAAS